MHSSKTEITNTKRVYQTEEYISGEETKHCSLCDTTKSIFKFKPRICAGRWILRKECRRCTRTRMETRVKDKSETQKEAYRAKDRARRASEDYRAAYLLANLRKHDSRHGRICNILVEEAAQIIAQPCSYCHRDTVPRTLDRINNALGHERGNVVPACGLCNYIRMDMPYDSWLSLVPAVKPLVLSGALDGMCGGRYSEKAPDLPARLLESST